MNCYSASSRRRAETERAWGGASITDMGPHELWDEPWEGLPEEEGAWEWDLVNEEENGPTKNPPDARPGWKRWYFVYHQPTWVVGRDY